MGTSRKAGIQWGLSVPSKERGSGIVAQVPHMNAYCIWQWQFVTFRTVFRCWTESGSKIRARQIFSVIQQQQQQLKTEITSAIRKFMKLSRLVVFVLLCLVYMFFNEREVHVYKLRWRSQNKVKNKIEEGLNEGDDGGSYHKAIG